MKKKYNHAHMHGLKKCEMFYKCIYPVEKWVHFVFIYSSSLELLTATIIKVLYIILFKKIIMYLQKLFDLT